MIATVNPATGDLVKTFEPLGDAAVDAVLERAIQAFATYRTTPVAERCALLSAVADGIDAEADDIAALMTLEMGKPLAAAKAEAAKCATAFRYYAAHAEAFLADEEVDPVALKATRAFVRYQPIGPVLAVMPWNFPWWQVTRFAAPALAAGNVGLLKHASNVPQTALRIEDVLRRAGVPEGVFQTLLIGSDQVAKVLRDGRVKAATVTGSTGAGSSVASIAGAAVKKTVLELGGSDPFVVLPSCDLDAAVRVGVTARCQNNGQSCIAAKRFIVHDAVYDVFTAAFTAAMAAQTVGDPMDPATAIGPLATEAGRSEVAAQVDDALAQGAHVLCGGAAPDRRGWYYPPTVVTGLTPAMRMWSEEVFGPVASVYRVAGIEEALELANATDYGLGANVWTRDPAEQAYFVDGFAAGMVFVNGMVTSFPALPFGGVKGSGYGRELWATGLREFCNAKSVWVGP